MTDTRRILDSFAVRVTRFGGQIVTFSIADPVTERKVIKAEKRLGYALPPRRRAFVTGESSGTEFSWTLDDDHAIRLDG